MKSSIFRMYNGLIELLKLIFKIISWLSFKVFLLILVWGVYSLIIHYEYKIKLLSVSEFTFYFSISAISIYVFKASFNAIKNYEVTQEKALAFANFIVNFVVGPIIIGLLVMLVSN